MNTTDKRETIEVEFGQFWTSRRKAWAAFVNGSPLRQENGMNQKVNGAVRAFSSRAAAELAARRELAR